MNALVLIFIIPIIAGILGFIVFRLRNEFNFLGAILTLYYSLYLFWGTRGHNVISQKLFTIDKINFGFQLDQFSGVIILGISLVSFLLLLYSFRYMRGVKHLASYYLYFMFTIAIANAVILSNNFIMFLIFSFILSIILYAFLIIAAQNSLIFAHQTFFLSLIFNVLISLGIYLIYHQSGNISMSIEPRIIPNNPVTTIALLCLLIGIIGKVGLFPLHFWIKNLNKLPVTIMTFIPMIIDKIIGIYLLFRISYYIFNINQLPTIRFVVLILGSISIMVAGLMAIRTKEIYQLLHYSSMTQFGFIFVGIGCGNAIGLASAVFHTINYLTFQPAMYLTAGSIEYWTKTTNLQNYQGLASKIPITFSALLIAVLANIGILPLNGFFSKLLLFQGLLKINSNNNIYPFIFIIIMCLGCIIIPIYLLRLLYAMKGQKTIYSERIRDPGFTMTFSPVLLSLLSIILGIFASSLSVNTIILPSINNLFSNTISIDFFTPALAPLLLVISLIIGIIFFYMRYVSVKYRRVV